MKIYGQDRGYRGASFVIANSQEEAIEMMKENDGSEFDTDLVPLEEIEIVHGAAFGGMGSY